MVDIEAMVRAIRPLAVKRLHTDVHIRTIDDNPQNNWKRGFFFFTLSLKCAKLPILREY